MTYDKLDGEAHEIGETNKYTTGGVENDSSQEEKIDDTKEETNEASLYSKWILWSVLRQLQADSSKKQKNLTSTRFSHSCTSF